METQSSKLKIYCETSFWSYLVGSLTSDEKVARCQALTRKWWEEVAPLCEIYVSQHVLDEAENGNVEKARSRLEFMSQATLVEGRSAAVQALANNLHTAYAVSKTQSTDALHIAASAVNGLDVLLKEARAKALGMTYCEYCLAQLKGTVPLVACEDSNEYDAKS